MFLLSEKNYDCETCQEKPIPRAKSGNGAQVTWSPFIFLNKKHLFETPNIGKKCIHDV
jgi:hypothetical protein